MLILPNFSSIIGVMIADYWERIRTVILLIASLLALSACATLPEVLPPRLESYALAPHPDGQLAEVTAAIRAKYGDELSAFLAVDSNYEALSWRLALIDHAVQSIDAQYFTWYADESSDLISLRILDAADRGVRVRILVDDMVMLGAEEGIAAVDQHPNVEIRVFNPWKVRSNPLMRGIEFIARGSELNRRMHNKILIADNQLAIMGGRNIGDKYFGFQQAFNFRDLDLLIAGPIVQEFSHVYDFYWNSEWGYPGSTFAPKKGVDPRLLSELRQAIRQEREDSAVVEAGFSLDPKDWSARLNGLPETMSVGSAKILFDEPPSADPDQPGTRITDILLADRDLQVAETAREEVIVVSAYFIPDSIDLAAIKTLTDRDVRVRILTNSLASNDETIANSGYKKYRRAILERGAELYELRPDAAIKSQYETVQSGFLSLHTKAFVKDDTGVFVGSLNLDPRSLNINTEMGVMVDDPILARKLIDLFERDMRPENSWRVMLDEQGRLMWVSDAGVEYREPARSLGQRMADGFFSLLPIEDQL